jgi:hypothetical protein
MFEVNLGEMLDQAEQDGGAGAADLWDDGRYKLEATRSNTGTTKDGKPKIGVLWKNLEGPNAGQSKWENISVNPESKVSVSIFINKLLSFGLSKDLLKENPPLEQVAEMLVGTIASVDVTSEVWKSDANKKSQKFKIVKLVDTNVDTEADEDASDESGLFGGLGD